MYMSFDRLCGRCFTIKTRNVLLVLVIISSLVIPQAHAEVTKEINTSPLCELVRNDHIPELTGARGRVLVLLSGFTSVESSRDSHISTWQDFLARFGHLFGSVVFFSYNELSTYAYSEDDTARSIITHSVPLLQRRLSDCFAQDPSIESFTLVGHSMGGVVIKKYMDRYGFAKSDGAAQRVSHVLALASPIHGLWLANCTNIRTWLFDKCSLDVTISLTSIAGGPLIFVAPQVVQWIRDYLTSKFKPQLKNTDGGFELGQMYEDRASLHESTLQSITQLSKRNTNAGFEVSRAVDFRFVVNRYDFVLAQDTVENVAWYVNGKTIVFENFLDGPDLHNVVRKSAVLGTSTGQQIESFLASNTPSQVIDVPAYEPPTAPANPNDANFTGKENPYDGSVVTPNQPFRKMWELQNSGGVAWDSRYRLRFVSGERMGAPGEVVIPPTARNSNASIMVDLIAPSQPGNYRGYWQMTDPHGTYFGDRVWVDIVVPSDQSSTVGSPSIACLNCPAHLGPTQTLRPSIRVAAGSSQLLPSRGDMLRNTDGNLFGAYPHIAIDRVVNAGQTIELSFSQDYPMRAPEAPGIYESKWRLWRNGGWDGPELAIRFEVKASGSTNRPPNPPTLTGPGDWAVYTGNGGIALSARQNGDPDNDAVSQYYFEIFDSAQNANSGWINSSTWSPQGLGFNGYQWRAKVRDSRGAESGWSPQVWHFTVQTNEPQIYSFSSQACRSAWGSTEQICFCAQTNAGTLRLQVNSATDGSANGTWQVLNELGTPNYNCASDSDRPPTWTQLEYETGRHLVRLYARRDGGWTAAASRDIYVDLPANRRPDTPGILLPKADSYVNSRTVLFDWKDTLRTTSYRLQIGTDSNLSTMLVDRTFAAGVSQYEHTFDQDYPQLYVRVTATGPYGTNNAGHYFRIDRTPPTSAIAALPSASTDSKVTVQWNGSDTQSGLNWYHIQVRDGNRADSTWQDWLVNTTKTAEIFTGLTGHTYYFRARAMDKVGNWEAWPAGDGDAVTRIDPTAVPPTVWWNRAFQVRRNLVVLNNDADALPVHFPVRLHFDGATSPTAAEIYAASLSAAKGNDLRIVYNNQTELNRIVHNFSTSAIDIWFPIQVALGGSQSDSSSYQLYIGNASAGTPPTDVNSVFMPTADGNTMGLWHFQEGSGGAVYDTARGHTGSFASAGWDTGLLGRTGVFNGSNSTVTVGNHSDFDYLGAFTLEAWVRQSRSGWGMVFDKGVNGFEQFTMRINGDNRIECSVGADGGNRTVTSSSGLQVNVWYHVACVHDGGSNQWVYINGNQVGSNNNSRPALNRTYPLYFGNAPYWGGMAFGGQIQHVRVSNVARHDFPYAKIETLPTVAAGSPAVPPIEGSADLAVVSVAVFPDTAGGHVVEAVVRNQGNLSTQNGFYSDLYLDHLPTGTGDYSGSVRFWVNSPIAAGATVTLTTKLENLVTVAAAAEASSAPQEASKLVYFQTDSAGVVKEASETNNVTASGIEVCTTVADAFEGDNGPASAAAFNFGTPQFHNFYTAGDEDWVRFQATSGNIYTFETSQLGSTSDTYMYLYGSSGSTVLGVNDDNGENLSSRIEWTAPASGQYYLRVRHWNPNVFGCGTSYVLSGTQRQGALPDLTVTGMWISLQQPSPCFDPQIPLGVHVSVANQGTAAAGAFAVDVNGASQTVAAGLTAGQSTTLFFTGYRMGVNTASVDPDNRIAESAEDNNISSPYLPVPTPPPPCQQQPGSPTPVNGTARIYLPVVAARADGSSLEYQAPATTPSPPAPTASATPTATPAPPSPTPSPTPTATTPPTATPTASNTPTPTATHTPTSTPVPLSYTWKSLGDAAWSEPRSGFGLAFDDSQNRLILFGGSCPNHACGDTYSYTSAGGWQNLNVAGPSPREDVVMVYDSARQKVVLFGGHPWGQSYVLNDTWEFSGSQWTQASPETLPPTRSNQAMAYDPVRQRVVMFGGWRNTQRGTDILDDTWEFDGTNWTQITLAVSPPARTGGRMAYVPSLGKIVLYGGLERDTPSLKDTWAYDGAAWTQIETAVSPPLRYYHQMAYNPVTDRIVVFGGRPYGGTLTTPYDDTWEFDGVNWAQSAPTTSPPGIWATSMIYYPPQLGILLFGGNSPNQGNYQYWQWRYSLQ